MPKAFDDCVSKGGRIRTLSRGKNKFQRICFRGGKSFAGEIKTKKKK